MRNATLLLACLVTGCFGDDRGHHVDDRPDADLDRPDAREQPDAEPPECATGEHCDLDCANGDDDDGDGLTDCADPNCDGFAGCTAGVERTCNDGIDNDGDGDEDCADAACGWGCAAITNCPATAELIVLAAGDTPMAIPDTTTVTSQTAVAETGAIVAVALRVDITHTYDADLDIVLAAPSGETVDVSSDNGSSGEDYDDTVFTDTAATGIAAGTPPYAGEFRPEQAFSTLDGVASAGTWELEITDDTATDVGTLHDAGMALCIAP
jgi:subtilisin-like proprotein convertase family protein